MQSKRYLGLDLAWAPRDSSGGAVMEPTEGGGVQLVSTSFLRSHEDVLSWVARNRGRGQAILAVNAPLIVENTTGRRPVDKELERYFGRYRIDEYMVNTVNASHPRTIARSLRRMGFDPDPRAEGDRMIETATQPAQIMLFGLERPLRIKTGPIGARKDAAHRYRELIYGKLPFLDPPLEDSEALEELVSGNLAQMNGTRLGDLETRLDATLCAWIAAYMDLMGPESCSFLGDLYRGYVLLPARPSA